jgi:hypothetical protein
LAFIKGQSALDEEQLVALAISRLLDVENIFGAVHFQTLITKGFSLSDFVVHVLAGEKHGVDVVD